jgi:dynein heavy chain
MFLFIDYNNILKALNTEERRLFKERVEFLDSKLEPGLNTLTWTSSDLGTFVSECRKHAIQINKVKISMKFLIVLKTCLCLKISDI